ncbi:MAG: hypothetical protein GC178_04940 [Flavobacteriales bacterium]|nr:hypothetical protein [Flavobacteriales bacterium]
MRVAIMQPYLFPYIGYFQLIHAVDRFVVFDDVNFIKRGWINRNRVLLNGNDHMFTVPLIGVSQNKLINEIRIDPNTKWREKILTTIRHAYKSAPHFDEVYPLIESAFMNDSDMISDYARNSLEVICKYLKIETSIISSSKTYNGSELKGVERIIDICKKEKANTYINAIGGTDLYNQSQFESDGIKLHFLKTDNISYTQGKNEFVKGLSIIDVVMFNSVEQTRNLLNQYQLI